MTYTAQNFDHLIGIKGLSEQLLKNHFTLYQGYVTNTNKLLDELAKTEKGTPQYAEMMRRFGWEWNGMRLHELYFGNLKKDAAKIAAGSKIHAKLAADFGSFENWEKDFRAAGAMRGIGWVILTYDTVAKRLLNVWINEHDVGHLSGTVPVLIMDVFEHAFMIDYGLKRADYINAFFENIDWTCVEKRLP